MEILCNVCNILESHIDAIHLAFDQRPDLRDTLTALVSRLVGVQFLTTPAPTPPPEPLQDGGAHEVDAGVDDRNTEGVPECGDAQTVGKSQETAVGVGVHRLTANENVKDLHHGTHDTDIESPPNPSSRGTGSEDLPRPDNNTKSPSQNKTRKRGAEDTQDCNLQQVKRSKYSESKSTAPRIVARIQKIASHETILRLWRSYRASRKKLQDIQDSGTGFPFESNEPMDETALMERLDVLKERSERAHTNTHFAKMAERVRHVQMVDLYQKAKALASEAAENPDGTTRLSLVDRFAERLFPGKMASSAEGEGETEGRDPTQKSTNKSKSKRKPHKGAFNRWLNLAKKLAFLVERYGWGILLLLSQDLTDEKWASYF